MKYSNQKVGIDLSLWPQHKQVRAAYAFVLGESGFVQVRA